MSESTRYTVLGLVRRRPNVYGYALVDEVSHWAGPEGVAPARRAVYKALRDLTTAQLIEPLEVSSDERWDGPNRRRFVATPEGDRRFVAWLCSPPESFADLSRRIATARRGDIPALLKLVIDAEHAVLGLQRDLRAPEVATLVKKGAPWKEMAAALLVKAELCEVAQKATFLSDLRRTLEELSEQPAHDPAQA